jgi:hypothetical protein
MMTRLSEVIHEWTGWCPDRGMASYRKEIIPWPVMNSQSLPVKGAFMREGILVDYGKTGISVRYFIGAVIAIVGIFMVLFLVARTTSFSLAGIPFCVLILSIAIITMYQDLLKAKIEITKDSLIIRRSLHWPVIIPKDTISAVEIRHNSPPLPLWLQKILFLIVVPASSMVAFSGEYLRFAAGEITSLSLFLHLGFFIGIVLLFLASYHHSLVRMQYPDMLVITTTTQQRAGVYGDNLKEMVKILGRSA